MKIIKKLLTNFFFLSILIFSCNTKDNNVIIHGDGLSLSDNVLMNKTFYNPLDIKKDIGDPWLYKHIDGYYYYTHSETGEIKVTKTSSPTNLYENLKDKTRTKIIFNEKDLGVSEIWAPEVFYFKGYWYAYFTATIYDENELIKDSNRRTFGIKSLTSDCFGKWGKARKIDLPLDYRSIDATFFEYKNKQYIVYSGWPNKNNNKYRQNLYIQELEKDDPLTCSRLETERHLISEPNNYWEIDGSTAQNEGPAVSFAPDGTPILFFSASFSGGNNYCISYLKFTGTNILEKESRTKASEPLMKTDLKYQNIISPGHNSIFKSPDGKEDWICYHAAKKYNSGWDRQVRLQKLDWNGNTPIIKKQYKVNEEVDLPSGDNVKRYKFEAENATLEGFSEQISAENCASSGKSISLINDAKIIYKVNVPISSLYGISIRYSNLKSSTENIILTINNIEYNLYAPKTTGEDTYFINTIFVDLYKHENSYNVIEIKCDKDIYIDCMILDYLNNL